MADGHFQDVELLRRELAILILEWAGKAVKDDPDGPMSTALTRAVGDAARGAVAEQHQVLATEAADQIAEALERRDRAGGLVVWRMRPWGLGVVGLVAMALLVVAFMLGLQTGRREDALPPAPAATAATAPIAPLAPSAEPPAPTSSAPRAQASTPPPTVRAERSTRSAAPPSRPSPRELGRPAPANDSAARATQPVGATATPPAATPGTTP